jgi:heme oxygenase
MGDMPDYTPHQRKIIERYYDQRDNIMLTRLQELTSELYLAETDAARDRLWKRVRTALAKLKLKPEHIEHIVASRDPAVLARNVKDLQSGGG